MGRAKLTVPEVLNQLEAFYGTQEPCWPCEPYLFLLWWYCGYPASDAACTKGWEGLTSKIGTEPDEILSARPAVLAAAIKSGGMLPELRAERMKKVAARIKDEFDGDLRRTLTGPIAKVHKILRAFIASPTLARTAFCSSPEFSR